MAARKVQASPEVLRGLALELHRFEERSSNALDEMQRELHASQEWLLRRHSHWRLRTEDAQRRLAQAEASLATCRRQTYRDRDGNLHSPDCSHYEREVRGWQQRLAEYRTELARATLWKDRVEAAAVSFQRVAQGLRRTISESLPKGRSELERRASDLDRYQAGQLLGGTFVLTAAAMSGVITLARRALDLGPAKTDAARRVQTGIFGEEILTYHLERLGAARIQPLKFEGEHGIDRAAFRRLNGRAYSIFAEAKASRTHLPTPSTRGTAAGHVQGSKAYIRYQLDKALELTPDPALRSALRQHKRNFSSGNYVALLGAYDIGPKKAFRLYEVRPRGGVVEVASWRHE